MLKSFMVALTVAARFSATSVQAAPKTDKSLYGRLGAVFAIAAVVDHFSDALVQLRRFHPGLVRATM